MLALAACGGGSGTLTQESSSGSGSGTGTGTTGNTTYSMGNGSGSGFQSGMIGVSSTNVSAGGTTSLQVAIVDQTGTLYTAGSVTVTFSSTCISQGLASVTASGSTSAGTNANTVVTTTGTADATYTAKGCSGSDVITASATVGSTNLTATGTVTVASAATGSIQFESATPTSIGLKGTKDVNSTLVFKVLDSTGAAKQGVVVSFALSTTVGGLSLSPATATSAADGTVQTVVSSGTVHTSVTVTASIASPALSTQSSELTVTTGIPASNTFSIAVGPATYASSTSSQACSNIEGYDTDGVTVPVTVSLADRYGNPVTDGTAVSFFTDGGKIDGSCLTGTGSGLTGPGTGACTVTWTSEDPRPSPTMPEPSTSIAPGRTMVLATAIGEESFTDVAETGFYQSGDPYVNLGEPYDDANENGQYDVGEHYLNYDGQSTYQGVVSGAPFVGIICNGTSPTSTCTENQLALGAQHLIIMSTAGVTLTCTSPGSCAGNGNALTVPVGGSASFSFNVLDGNGNPPPAGMTITSSVSGSIGSISSGASITVGCSTAAPGAGITYTVYVTGPTSPGSGTITVQATSPGTATMSPPLIIAVTAS